MSEVPANGADEPSQNTNQTGGATTLLDEKLQAAIRDGMQAYSAKDYAGAISRLEVFAGSMDFWKPLVCLGLSYYNIKRYAAAEATFAHIVENCKDPELVGRAVQALDRVRATIGDPSASYTSIPKLNWPADTGVHLGLDKPVAEGESDPLQDGILNKEDLLPADRERYIKLGTRHYLNGRYEDAIKYLDAGLSGEDEHWNARLALAMSYHKVGQTELGETLMTAILDKCQDKGVLARAKQAMDSIKFEQVRATTAERKAFDETLALHQAEKEKTAERRKAEAQEAREAAQAKWQAEREQRSAVAKLPRKMHPLAPVVLVVLLLGIGYYFSLRLIPGVYNKIVMQDVGSYGKSVGDYGALEGVQPQLLSMPGANGSKITGAYYEKPGAGRCVIIHSATFDDWAMRKALATSLLQAGVSVLVYDAHGHGRTGGAARWQSIADDGLFAYDYLRGKIGIKGANIVSYGYSLGCAPAAATGEMRDHGLIILENPFPTITQIAREKMPLLWLVPDSLCPEQQHRYLQTDRPDHPHANLVVIASKDPMVSQADTLAFFSHVFGNKDYQNSPVAPATDLIVKLTTK
jgi:tetratricopeptide (TPR) repeat protein